MTPKLSLNDPALLGVAGKITPSVEECWHVAGLNDGSNYGTATPSNQAVCSGVADTNNGMYDWGVVKSVAVFVCCPATLSGGTFRTGVWDSTGANKAQSNQFTCADMAVGTTYPQVVKLSKALTSSTTIADGDRVGIICNSAPSGDTAEIKIGTKNPVSDTDWLRWIFVEGSVGTSIDRAILVCLST
jgi:hypothetical protein